MQSPFGAGCRDESKEQETTWYRFSLFMILKSLHSISRSIKEPPTWHNKTIAFVTL